MRPHKQRMMMLNENWKYDNCSAVTINVSSNLNDFNDHNDSRHPVPHWYSGLQWTHGQECWSEMMVTTICQNWVTQPSPAQPSPAQAVLAPHKTKYDPGLVSPPRCFSAPAWLWLTAPGWSFCWVVKFWWGMAETRHEPTTVTTNTLQVKRTGFYLVCRQVRLPGTAGGETIIQCAHNSPCPSIPLSIYTRSHAGSSLFIITALCGKRVLV